MALQIAPKAVSRSKIGSLTGRKGLRRERAVTAPRNGPFASTQFAAVRLPSMTPAPMTMINGGCGELCRSGSFRASLHRAHDASRSLFSRTNSAFLSRFYSHAQLGHRLRAYGDVGKLHKDFLTEDHYEHFAQLRR